MFSHQRVILSFVGLVACAAATATTPEQIHIAFAGDDGSGNANGMAISWTTMAATATSTVLYGTSPSSLTHTATGTSVQYLAVRCLVRVACC